MGSVVSLPRVFFIQAAQQSLAICHCLQRAPAPHQRHHATQLCPLKAAARLGRVLPGLDPGRVAEQDLIAKTAAAPVTLGGALMLLAADNATAAAALQSRLCGVLIDPAAHCAAEAGAAGAVGAGAIAAAAAAANGSSAAAPFSGDEHGPLKYHLDAKDSVTEFLAAKLLPLAMAPAAAGLRALPDALCSLPPDALAGMPPAIKAQMVRGGGEAGRNVFRLTCALPPAQQ